MERDLNGNWVGRGGGYSLVQQSLCHLDRVALDH